MEKVIYNLVFNRKKQLNAEGKALIQVEAYLNRQKRYFSTKVYVKPCQWDNKRRSIKNHPNMDALNLYLQNYVMELERDELEKRQANNGFSLKDLREEASSTSTSSSFLVFMREEILHSNLKESTLKNHLSTLHVLSLYKKDVLFKDINFNFLCDFEYFLLKQEYHRNTIAKHMKHLKRYINLAINKELFELHKYPFRKYKIKYQESKRTHLTPEELGRLENLKLDGQRTLRRCLDMFLFSCYTGLRFSDIVSITKENFLIIDDKVWLVYSSVKTDVSVRLPLFLLFEGKSLPIYERYKNAPRTLFGVPLSSNIGLDAPSRDLLVEMLGQMTKLNGVQVVLLLSNPNDIPAMITHVLPIHDRTCLPPLTREEFMSDTELIARLFPTEGIHACEEVGKVRLPVDMNKIASLHEVTLRMEHVKIRYGSRTILKDLDWEIKNGEKWALFGPNGAGKSTLLSLVYADNPQSYANTLYLFDRKRGSGESIWDIKKRIGYVSPEMHLYYKENVPTLNIVGSGFFDSIGLFRKCNAEQETVALEWMKVFGIEHLKDRLFLTLSSGEQRLALLARAFVKDPDLIILDEPLHGLDVSNKKKAAAIIEQFCDRPGKTLIYVTHYPHELPACVDKRFELVKHS